MFHRIVGYPENLVIREVAMELSHIQTREATVIARALNRQTPCSATRCFHGALIPWACSG